MLQERCILENGFCIELFIQRPGQYRLALWQDGKLLVDYSHAGQYEFKSVEKLRYDFEQDVEKALRQG